MALSKKGQDTLVRSLAQTFVVGVSGGCTSFSDRLNSETFSSAVELCEVDDDDDDDDDKG